MINQDPYLSQIKQFTLLTPKEEFELAVRYRDHKDREAAEKLITSNLRFVVKSALAYKSSGVKLSDLIQEGNIGLIMALEKFDPNRGCRFISYAVWWIRANIQNFIMKNWSLVKIAKTRSEKKLYCKIQAVREELESNREKDEKYEIVARDFSVAKQDVIEMEQSMSARDLYLDASFDEDNDLTHLDLVQGDAPDQEELFAREEERKIQEDRIISAMKVLSEREAYVIKNRIMADNPLTLREIGNDLKVTRERVRQLEGKALAKLRRRLTNYSAHPGSSSLCYYPRLNLKNFQRRALPPQQGMSHFDLLSSPPQESAATY